MRDYSKVSPSLWQSERFNGLPTDDARYLYLYLLTNEHQTMAGCYRLPTGYACTDLRWTPERYTAALADLEDSGLVLVDPGAQVIGITRWFRHNPPLSENHLTGIERQLERLPSDTIAEAMAEAAQEAWEAVRAEKAAKAAKAEQDKKPAPDGTGNGHLTQTTFMTGRR